MSFVGFNGVVVVVARVIVAVARGGGGVIVVVVTRVIVVSGIVFTARFDVVAGVIGVVAFLKELPSHRWHYF